MNVLHLRASNFFGGPEKQILLHERQCRLRGIQTTIATFDDGERSNEFVATCKAYGANTYVFPRSAADPVAAAARLATFLTSRHVDLVCVHGYKPAILMALLSGLGRRVPVVGFIRGRTREGYKVTAFQNIEELCYPRFQSLVAVSQSEADRIREKLGQTKQIHVVRNAVDCAERTDNSPDPRGFPKVRQTCRLVVAGRLTEEKGHQYLIDSLQEIKLTHPDVHLVICGDGPLQKKLCEQVEALGLRNEVTFAGFRTDMPNVYSWMDVLVLPSLSEGIPNVVLEAMAHEKIVVATRVGGVPEVVEDEISGFLVEAGNVEALTLTIRKALAASAGHSLLGRHARARVQREFSFENQASQLVRIYEEAIRDFQEGI